MRRLLTWLFRRNPPAPEPEPPAEPIDPLARHAWNFLNDTVQPQRPERAEVLLTAPSPVPRQQAAEARPPALLRPPAPVAPSAPVAITPPTPPAARLRKLIVYGNCQAAFIEFALNKLEAVRSRWTVVRHDVWATGEALEANLADFEECDVLLQQEVRNWRTHPLRDRLSPQMRVVRFPFCYFAALWPFDSTQNGMDPNWVHEKGLREFGYADNMLARLRTEVPDPEQRLASYRRLDMPDCVDIARYAEFECARLLRLDSKLDFTIGRYIADNYKTTRLFHAITHPSTIVMTELILQIMAKLDMRDARFDEALPDILAFFQVPIHPLVIERLGLAWAGPDDRYKFSSEESLTFDEYVRRYIAAYG